ncbi:hypothetical protein [Actinomadura roseirufa]|uniref:hypothetical protein n=1 Tax=Actinomadura roseirufa TaxID=2094049 RepID=UPI001041B026|nr:hypothetical protein [Actinomadura roseirufa]
MRTPKTWTRDERAAAPTSTTRRPQEPLALKAQRSARTSQEGCLAIEGGAGVYLLLDPETRDIRGTLLDQGGGWWKCRTPRGNTRQVFIAPDVADPWLNAAERMAAS